jgi:regulator of sirC expression with transglutaminase-like and TPR domain
LVILLPEAWDERRDRGLVHAELGHVHEALQDLRQYLEFAPAAPDTAALRNRVNELSAL